MLQVGHIVEFLHKNKILMGVCQQADEKSVRLLTELNKEQKLSRNKILNAFDSKISLSLNRSEIISQLKDQANKANQLVIEVDLELLWEILEDDSELQDLETLAELNFNENSDLNRSTLLRALYRDTLFFDRKSNGYIRRNAKVIEQIRHQQLQQQRKEEARQNTINWLQSALSEEPLSDPPEFSKPYLDLIKNFAIQRKRFDKYSQAMDFLKEARWKGDIEQQGFDLMVRMGKWDIDENLSLIEMNVPQHFSEDILKLANSFELSLDESNERRRDLRQLYTLTIDDENTTDIDDAISWEKQEDGYLLGIHIADVSHYIEADSPLDKESIRRFTSIYLPERKIEMLPAHLAQNICSLVANEDRLALSILIKLNEDLSIREYEICESIIHVDLKLSYDKAEELIESQTEFKMMYQLAKSCQDKRVKQGAMIYYLPELRLKVDKEKQISMKIVNRDSASQNLVSELMILANALIAKKMASEQVPLIYRTQEKLEGVENSNRPIMKKSTLSTLPAPHAGLGLDVYTQFTSPIRRYNDLILHRQIKTCLREKPLHYSIGDLEQLVALSDQALYAANIVQKEGFKYWLYKYMEQLESPVFEAEVVDKMDDSDKLFIYLKDFCFQTAYYPMLGQMLRIGDQLKVTISHINPRKGVLQLRPYQEDD